MIGEVSLGVKSTMTETEIREKILSKPSPDHLIPVLQELPLILVVEDFHYLKEAVKENIFQQWKIFTDNEVSVIVVGTTHHAVELAYANKDLIGRISQIDLSTWKLLDLEKIANQGFNYLKVTIPSIAINEISKESVGLPILVQDTCLQIFTHRGISEIKRGETKPSFSRKDVYRAFYNVAITNYSQFEAIYERLKAGPRKKARKYNTYEIVLSLFTKDPLVLSLKRYEIEERLNKLPLPVKKKPPATSINSMLKALSGFQKDIGLEFLEWSYKEQTLIIIESSFLFYLRWRTKRAAPPTIADMLSSMVAGINLDEEFYVF